MITLSAWHIFIILIALVVVIGVSFQVEVGRHRKLREELIPSKTECPKCGQEIFLAYSLFPASNIGPPDPGEGAIPQGISLPRDQS